MIRSMTGFGKGDFNEEGKFFTVEIRTTNHRYNDISVKIPRQVSYLEDKVRDVVLQYMSRGKIEIFITYEDYSGSIKNVFIDEGLAEAYIKAAETIRNKFDVMDDITVSFIAKLPDVIKITNENESEEELWSILKKALDAALGNLIAMREKEGERLAEDLIERIDFVGERLKEIEIRAPEVVKEYKKKLENRIKELLEQEIPDENRINMEVVLFADKCNINEEIVRLKSHIAQMKETLQLQEPVGKKLDFLVQEMLREVNTIGSKANNLVIIKEVLAIKHEIEKMREQIQNIE